MVIVRMRASDIGLALFRPNLLWSAKESDSWILKRPAPSPLPVRQFLAGIVSQQNSRLARSKQTPMAFILAGALGPDPMFRSKIFAEHFAEHHMPVSIYLFIKYL